MLTVTSTPLPKYENHVEGYLPLGHGMFFELVSTELTYYFRILDSVSGNAIRIPHHPFDTHRCGDLIFIKYDDHFVGWRAKTGNIIVRPGDPRKLVCLIPGEVRYNNGTVTVDGYDYQVPPRFDEGVVFDFVGDRLRTVVGNEQLEVDVLEHVKMAVIQVPIPVDLHRVVFSFLQLK